MIFHNRIRLGQSMIRGQSYLRAARGHTGQYHLRKRVVETRDSHRLILRSAPHHPLTRAVLTC